MCTCIFLAIKSVTLSDVTAITFITPIIIILGSIFFLRNTKYKAFIFRFIGFFGILIILKLCQNIVPIAIY